MGERKRYSSIGAVLRAFGCKEYWEKNGQIAIYRRYRFRWFARHPNGGWVITGRTTSHVAGCENIRLTKFGDEPAP